MRYHFWYILIHITLGIVGSDIFTFTNLGGIYAAAASVVVQSYAVWEIHKEAYPKFQGVLRGAHSLNERNEMIKGYRVRLGRVLLFRTCIYALLTLMAGMAVRGGAHV